MDFQMSDLEMTMLKKFQDKVHEVDPKIPSTRDPQKKKYFRKEIMQFRDELKQGQSELLKIRRAKLKRLLIAETKQQIRWLRNLGYEYVPIEL